MYIKIICLTKSLFSCTFVTWLPQYTHIHIVTHMVILRSAYDTECKSTFSDVCMAPVSYCTSLVRIIHVSMCVHMWFWLLHVWRYMATCIWSHSCIHCGIVISGTNLHYVYTVYTSCKTRTLYIL